MPHWKLFQSKRKKAQKTKLALISLGVILSLLLLAQTVKLTRTLFSPWRMDSERSYAWDGDHNLNFLIRAREISLVSFNSKEQKVSYISLPNSTFLEVARGFGKWQLSAVYDLGGDNLLKESLSQFFGLPIEGVMGFSGKYRAMSTADLIKELKSPFSIFGILPDLKSNLTPFELFRLSFGMGRVRFDKISKINLESLGILEKTSLADGTQIFTADSLRLDSALSLMADPQIRSEHKTVAVFNATEHPGLAGKAARVIANIGGDVIITSNSEKRLKKTVVLGEKSKTLERLWQIFGKSGTIDPNLEDKDSSRAAISVFLGEDFAPL